MLPIVAGFDSARTGLTTATSIVGVNANRGDTHKSGESPALRDSSGQAGMPVLQLVTVEGLSKERGGSGGRARWLGRIHQCPRFRGPLREWLAPWLWRRRAEWRGG